MGMAVSMAAMMAPTAAPFFVAFGRDTKRPAAVAITIAVYVAMWALIGAAAGLLMAQVMLPPSTLGTVLAIAVASVYVLMPWSRWARTQCRAMCRREERGSGLRNALLEGSTYAMCCVMCTAGVMGALVVLGMTNVVLMAAAASAMLVYKLI